MTPKQNNTLQTREIDADDRADLGVDEDNEDDDASSSDSGEPLARPEADKIMITELWAFTFSKQFYGASCYFVG